jgi:uncharacterized protein (TIGR02145 family)
MKKLLLISAFFIVLQVNAQTYLINFSGMGASSTVNSVRVDNLTRGTTLTISGSDILRLTSATGIYPVMDLKTSEFKIYPNPSTDNSIVEFTPPVAGDAVITVLDMAGRPVATIKSYLENIRQDFKISGTKKGIYLINVKGSDYQFSGKLLSNRISNSAIKIEKTNSTIQAIDEKGSNDGSKGTEAYIDMTYSAGERLKLTGISGNYRTVKIDIPASDKTIIFYFVSCTDGDNNNYPVVAIGSQTWMVENLKTTKYNNSSSIPLVTGSTAWAALSTPGYCWYDNNEAAYKAIYGALYNWYAVDATSNGGKNICPTGWHVPTDGEWMSLVTSLGGESTAGGKIKEPGFTYWQSPNTSATNESGYSALPGGSRTAGGVFYDVTLTSRWWSSTVNSTSEAWYQSIHHNGSSMDRNSLNDINGISVRCLLGDMPLLPVVTTAAASSITVNSAVSGGNVTSDGGATVTQRGVCWSTSTNPDITGSHTSNGSGTGSFTSNLTGLLHGYQYFVRAYATSSAGTSYGNEITLNTKIDDVDGNTYNTVTIGTQVWMAENLKTTKYKDGVSIPYVTDDYEWYMHSTPAYCWYNNDAATYKNLYGGLYNWYAVNTNKLCPAGWHPPSNTEWETLATYLGGKTVAGGKLKEAGTSHWLSPNTGGTNESGFTALPGGSRSWGGSFGGVGSVGVWWSNSYGGGDGDQTYKWSVINNSEVLTNNDDYSEKNGPSVRCLRGDLLLAPVLTTRAVTSITKTTAVSGGSITSAGDGDITSRGLCWNTSGAPTIADSHSSYGFGVGSFSFTFTGLTPGVKYYVRAYATNIVGTSYGESVSFSTQIADVDGNSYNTVIIGSQLWMAENLKTRKYSDGTSIPNTTLDATWAALTTGSYCDYSNTPSNSTTYGRLYNWYAGDNNAATKMASNGGKNVCPTGWHVPGDADWTALENYLIANGYNYDGSTTVDRIAKSLASTSGWNVSGITGSVGYDQASNNRSGFTALPGGYRTSSGAFNAIGNSAYWWASTNYSATWAWYRSMYYMNPNLFDDKLPMQSGYSIRCLKD